MLHTCYTCVELKNLDHILLYRIISSPLYVVVGTILYKMNIVDVSLLQFVTICYDVRIHALRLFESTNKRPLDQSRYDLKNCFKQCKNTILLEELPGCHMRKVVL